ncbi:MAG: hypothetical protein KKD74_05690 [Bacteroidetes bacterium]|nr:hypothetical protein [Bacteroidales bacterium]MBU1009608.1 hypothetical protein [Bacteroidota bacterium]
MSKETENISKIRDILIGNNITEMEKRFVRIEDQFRHELHAADRKWHEQHEKLSQYTHTGLGNISENTGNELREQQRKLEQLSEDLQFLKARLQEHRDQTRNEFDALRKLLHDHYHDTTEALQKAINEVKDTFIQRLAEVQVSKIDRSSLAVLFSQLALQVSDEADHTEPTSQADAQ